MDFSRKKTSCVSIGSLAMGSDYPIRLQSMTNTDTRNETDTISQVKRIIDAGAELVRITVPSMQEIRHLEHIKHQLTRENIHIPLVADVHFNPKVAEAAARIVEKVRINPGNYVDKKSFKQIELTDSQYQESLERMAVRAKPLLEICKQHGTAIRIGTNHGSLSDRIISRYGNTPEAMAKSAIEWIDICENQNFRNIVLSMKSSNVKVMIESTLLLAGMMEERGAAYPLHLGVTEAGAGLEGRIKSAVGIGTVLLHGLGDTIRVSLTEKPENEIPFARKIVEALDQKAGNNIQFKEITYSELVSIPAIVVASQLEREKARSQHKFHLINIQSIGDIHRLINEIEAKTDKKEKLILCFSNYEKDLDLFLCHISFICGYFSYREKMAGIIVRNDALPKLENNNIALEIMQACRLKISKTEFISCPSCGRTQYNIESVLAQVKERFSDHAGLKLGVMGCIVNGPGEMADADYGIVGAANGKVALYKGKERLTGNITIEKALDLLEDLVD